MSDSKKHNRDEKAPDGLSKEDAALWQKVVNTLDQTAIANKKSAPVTPEKKSEPDQQDIIRKAKKAALSPSTEEFKALLDGEPINKTIEKTNRPQSQQTPNTPTVKSAQPKKAAKPKIENFNQRDARNISSGKQTIDAAIDLHGLTQRQAETALKTFLKRAHLDEKRTVLVITGKGQKRDHHERSFELGAPEPGIIRRSVPNWLDDMPDIVISYTTSHSKHGGEGALYVRLRRLAKTKR